MTDQELLAALAAEPCLKAAVERIMGERDEARRMARLYRRFIKDVSTLQKAIRHVWKGPFFKEGEEDVEKEWLNADWLRQEE